MRILLILLLLSMCGIVYLLVDRSDGENSTNPHRAAVPPSVTRKTSGSDSLSLTPTFRRLTSSALEQRKAARRVLQRTGYANVLADVVRRDGIGALLSLTRLNAQVSYSLSHRPFVLYFPIVPPPDSVLTRGRWHLDYHPDPPFEVTLHDDWSMPEDPWK